MIWASSSFRAYPSRHTGQQFQIERIPLRDGCMCRERMIFWGKVFRRSLSKEITITKRFSDPSTWKISLTKGWMCVWRFFCSRGFLFKCLFFFFSLHPSFSLVSFSCVWIRWFCWQFLHVFSIIFFFLFIFRLC